jgi:hypothetical protein
MSPHTVTGAFTFCRLDYSIKISLSFLHICLTVDSLITLSYLICSSNASGFILKRCLNDYNNQINSNFTIKQQLIFYVIFSIFCQYIICKFLHTWKIKRYSVNLRLKYPKQKYSLIVLKTHAIN